MTDTTQSTQVTQAEWEAAVKALPKQRPDDGGPFNAGFNVCLDDLISEGWLMDVLIAAEQARRAHGEQAP